MTQAVIYTRVSSREQQQEGFSLEAQSKLLKGYAERNGLNIVAAFEDVQTAKKTGRKQFGEMLAYFRRNRSCRVLLVEKTDRLSRNFHDHTQIDHLDIAVHLVKEGRIISKDSKSQDKFMHGINIVLAQHYIENQSEEVKKGIRKRMDDAYTDKLDGKITEEFWERKSNDWRIEEQQVKMAIEGLKSAETSDRALDAQRIFELANKAYLLYVSQDSTEKAKLLKMLFSNCSVDAVSVTPTYRKPFDMIFQRAKLEEWSGRLDSN